MLTVALGAERAATPGLLGVQFSVLVESSLGRTPAGAKEIALTRLQDAIALSPVLRRAEQSYWRREGAKQGLHQLDTNKHVADPLSLERLCPDSSFAHNLEDAHLRMGRTWLKARLLEDANHTSTWWQGLARDGNLGGLLQRMEVLEQDQWVPHLLAFPGTQWRDTAGNNLGHLLAGASNVLPRKALLRLARDPQGAELIMTPNHKGQTVVDLIDQHHTWAREHPQFSARLALQVSRTQRKLLTGVAKETKTPRSKTVVRAL
jgi:hypothetical protein